MTACSVETEHTVRALINRVCAVGRDCDNKDTLIYLVTQLRALPDLIRFIPGCNNGQAVSQGVGDRTVDALKRIDRYITLAELEDHTDQVTRILPGILGDPVTVYSNYHLERCVQCGVEVPAGAGYSARLPKESGGLKPAVYGYCQDCATERLAPYHTEMLRYNETVIRAVDACSRPSMRGYHVTYGFHYFVDENGLEWVKKTAYRRPTDRGTDLWRPSLPGVLLTESSLYEPETIGNLGREDGGCYVCGTKLDKKNLREWAAGYDRWCALELHLPYPWSKEEAEKMLVDSLKKEMANG